MSRLSDMVAEQVWLWMNECRRRGATDLEAEIRETEVRIFVNARCIVPKPAEHITLTFKIPEE